MIRNLRHIFEHSIVRTKLSVWCLSSISNRLEQLEFKMSSWFLARDLISGTFIISYACFLITKGSIYKLLYSSFQSDEFSEKLYSTTGTESLPMNKFRSLVLLSDSEFISEFTLSLLNINGLLWFGEPIDLGLLDNLSANLLYKQRLNGVI